MTSQAPPPTENEEFWRDFLTRGDRRERQVRHLLARIPSGSRCQMCAAPFEGPVAPVMRALGKRRAEKNPRMCMSCFTFMADHHGGAEIDCTLLFADVRGSTALAEKMAPGEYHALLDRFYAVAARVVFDHDGAVDKFVGDEIVATFFPLLSGDGHAAAAVSAARALLVATGHEDPAGPWLPMGAGVHTGRVWMGAVGEGPRTELTALGDAVNTAARLAGAAGRGEVLVSLAAAAATGLTGELERRSLDLKGKESAFDVVALHVAPAAAGAAGDERR